MTTAQSQAFGDALMALFKAAQAVVEPGTPTLAETQKVLSHLHMAVLRIEVLCEQAACPEGGKEPTNTTQGA
jgi:hypothetical protein